ncbi:putative DNA-binding protein [Desulfosarcina variabilis str. Montpellier]|uniref:CHC2 zinc finger domain-containing protein n=1 Tax=Desulfosarcina variabilis TaxID=2300 RepID=UPI003AFB538A
MAGHCFSKSELYTLRNETDVRMLIEKTLCIPCRVTQGCFRFMCPLCQGFNTAVNPKTNLGRCFACEKNFNTIDLVMLVRQTDFVHSVKFLQSILQKDGVSPKPENHRIIRGSPPQVDCRPNHRFFSKRSDNGPSHIGNILGDVLPSDDGLPEKPIAALEKANEGRIAKLEMQLDQLGRQIQKLTQMITAILPSK